MCHFCNHFGKRLLCETSTVISIRLISDVNHEQLLNTLASYVKHHTSRSSVLRNYFPISESGFHLCSPRNSAGIQWSCLSSQHLSQLLRHASILISISLIVKYILGGWVYSRESTLYHNANYIF